MNFEQFTNGKSLTTEEILPYYSTLMPNIKTDISRGKRKSVSSIFSLKSRLRASFKELK